MTRVPCRNLQHRGIQKELYLPLSVYGGALAKAHLSPGDLAAI